MARVPAMPIPRSRPRPGAGDRPGKTRTRSIEAAALRVQRRGIYEAGRVLQVREPPGGLARVETQMDVVLVESGNALAVGALRLDRWRRGLGAGRVLPYADADEAGRGELGGIGVEVEEHALEAVGVADDEI